MAVSENALAKDLLIDNRYKIESVLGEDWFGITYKAHDNSLDFPVVLKEYFPKDCSVRADDKINVQPRHDLTDDFEFGLDQFVDEARTFAKYQHKNMIRISNIIKTNGTAYYVKDFEEGSALDVWLVEHKTIDEKIILNIITPLLKGLEEIHGNGLLHRNINPGNIIIRKQGGAMLIDSGNARHAIAEQRRNLAITVTPGYSPPEQYSSRGKQGPHTDIYAIGAVLYRLIVGKDPIESVDRVHDVHEGEPDPLITASDAGHNKVSNWLLILTDQLLSIATKDRPQTAESVLTAIKNKTIASVNTDFDSFFSDDDIKDFTVKSVSQQENESVQAIKEAPVDKPIDKDVTPETLAAGSQNQKSNTPVIIGGVFLLMVVAVGGYLYTQPSVLNELLGISGKSVQLSETENKEKQLAKQKEEKRIAAEKEAKRLAAEKKAKQIAAEKEAKLLAAEKKAKRIAAEKKAKRLAAEKEAKRLAAEKEAKRIAAEKEAKRIAAEKEAKRIAAEKEAKRIAAEKEAKRIAAEKEAKRIAAEKEAKRLADEKEAKRLAKEKFEAETKARVDQAASYRDQAFSKAMEGNVEATRELLKKAAALVIDAESDRTIIEGAISQKKALGR